MVFAGKQVETYIGKDDDSRVVWIAFRLKAILELDRAAELCCQTVSQKADVMFCSRLLLILTIVYQDYTYNI